MSAIYTRVSCTPRPRMRGFTLVELMVTIAIALFLLGGLVMIVQNVRQTYGNQQSLAQLQDAQRFAMTVITDVVQAAGYFPTPATETRHVLVPSGGTVCNRRSGAVRYSRRRRDAGHAAGALPHCA